MTILIASTNWWHNAARLAIALGKAGARIAVTCPAGNPVLQTRVVSEKYPYGAMNPLTSLEDAIEGAKPDFIIPTDDQAVAHLHELHAKAVKDGVLGLEIRELIENSLGAPENYDRIRSRSQILEIAKEEDILIPDGMAIVRESDLEIWSGQRSFPWVIKNDGSCAGTGVKMVSSIAEAQKACRSLAAQPTFAAAAKRLVANRDPFPMKTWLKGVRPALTVQSFVSGSPANCAVACWKGEVLAAFSVAVHITQHPTGAASIVRLVDNPSMLRAAERLTRRLGISGFCGLDFVIDGQTGEAYFIELNPRVTQLCHLTLGPGRDLTAAFYARLSNSPETETPCTTEGDTIAIFPNAWRQGIGRDVMTSSFQDVPWEEPALVSELMRSPWPERRALHIIIELFRSLLTPRTKKSKYFVYRKVAHGMADCSSQRQPGPAVVQ